MYALSMTFLSYPSYEVEAGQAGEERAKVLLFPHR
jgi:hypothetical protein